MDNADYREFDRNYPDEADSANEFRLWDVIFYVNGEVTERVGWQDLTTQVAEIYQSIPESEKPRTVILAATTVRRRINLYGDEYGLPRVITGSNSMRYRGYGEP